MGEVNVIIVNGYPRAGKDTFVNYCLWELREYGYAISTVDSIKEIAYKAGWDGEKTPEARKALSDLKDIFSKWLDLSYNDIRKKIRYIEGEANAYGLNPNKFFLFVHSREPEEIARFVNDFNAVTVFIDRPQEETEYSNHADEKVGNYEYDFIISNDGSLSQLQTNAKLFLAQIKDERGIE